MTKHDQRIGKVLDDMSPEEKARWYIEGPYLGHDVTPAEARQLLDRMKPEEGRRYNAYLRRWDRLRGNLRNLLSMVVEVNGKLLGRDRILWYCRGVGDLEEDLVFSSSAKPLLVENPNLKPGRPLEICTLLATVRLGVWGKRRMPVGKKPGVELTATAEQILDAHAGSIRELAAECKALARYVEEEARAMGMGTMETMARAAVQRLIQYDRPLLRDIMAGVEGRPPTGAVFPVEERWALVWEEVEEDAETARRVREDPANWQPPSVDPMLGGRSLADLYREAVGEAFSSPS